MRKMSQMSEKEVDLSRFVSNRSVDLTFYVTNASDRLYTI